MRLRFQSSLKETMSFAQAFEAEYNSKVVPKWFGRVSTLVLFGGLVGIAYPIFPEPAKIIALFLLVGLLVWLWNKAYVFCYRQFLDQEISQTSNAYSWTFEIEGAYLTAENRGVRTSFPLRSLAFVFERDGFVYCDFGILGRTRVPVGAFVSDQQRAEFIELVDKRKKELVDVPAAVTQVESGSA